MITLDYRDHRPIYEQVIERFQDLMFREILKPGDKMPSVRSLATDLSINPNTIQRAYVELERQGFICTVKGKGSFVSDSSHMKEGRLRQWENDFDNLLKKAWQFGISREIIEARIKRFAQTQGGSPEGQAEKKTEGQLQAQVQGTEERGEDHD